MTRLEPFDRQLESWLEAEASFPVPVGLQERAVEITSGRRPRPAVVAWVGSHWVSGAPAGRLAAMQWARPVVVAVMILILLGAVLLVGSGARPKPPSDLPLLYDRDGDILMTDWDGANPVVIADGAPPNDRLGTWYTGGDWAPDGSHLAYNEVRPGEVPSVITHISDGSGRRLSSLIIEGPAVGTPGDRQLKSTWTTWWSPDSTLLATFPWTAKSIRIFGLDGQLKYDLPLPDGYGMWRELGFTWAPDGRSVLVVITSQPSGSVDLSDREVWQLGLDRSAPRRLSDDDPLASWDLAASHDGRRVAFSGHNSPFEDGPIFVANSDGTDPRPVANTDSLRGEASFPMWSPDDTQIAYMVALDGGGLLNELRVVDVRTGVDRLVVTAREDGSVNRGWSPAGDRLLFRAYWLDPDIDIHRDKTALWSVRLDGTDPRLMVEDVGGFDVRP